MVTMTINKVKHKTGFHHKDASQVTNTCLGSVSCECGQGDSRFSGLMHQRIDTSGVDYLMRQSTDI